MKTDGPPTDYKFLRTIGNRIKRLREELTDHSAEEFALKVELDPDWYKNIEEGKVDAYVTDLLHISDFYPGLGASKIVG